MERACSILALNSYVLTQAFGTFEETMRTKLRTVRILSAVCLLAAGATVAWAQTSSPPQPLPDSPSAVVKAPGFEGQTSSATPSSQPSQPQSQAVPNQKPVGTAAAETPAVTGVAASNPAGAAIAPARQKRVRELFIKVGAILAAGVAVGTVAALASASPSKPAGATQAFHRGSSPR